MLNLNSVDKFLNQVYRSFTVGDLVTIEAFSHRNLIVLSGIEHEYILNISIDDFSVYKAEPSKMITGVTPHLDLEVEVELIRCEDGFVVCIKDEKGDISYHRCIPEWKDHQAYVIRSNKLRNNLPVLKIKERPNGDAEFIHSDFMIKLPIKFSRILDNLNYSTLGNVGSRYNPDGSQDNVYVVIHYNPDTGHSVTITDSNSKRHYSLEKEEDNMFGLPKIEDVRKKTDEALEISIAKIGSAITEASTLGESSVLISKGGFPDSSLRRIMEEISKTGYMVSHISSGELVIAW